MIGRHQPFLLHPPVIRGPVAADRRGLRTPTIEFLGGLRGLRSFGREAVEEMEGIPPGPSLEIVVRPFSESRRILGPDPFRHGMVQGSLPACLRPGRLSEIPDARRKGDGYRRGREHQTSDRESTWHPGSPRRGTARRRLSVPERKDDRDQGREDPEPSEANGSRAAPGIHSLALRACIGFIRIFVAGVIQVIARSLAACNKPGLS